MNQWEERNAYNYSIDMTSIQTILISTSAWHHRDFHQGPLAQMASAKEKKSKRSLDWASRRFQLRIAYSTLGTTMRCPSIYMALMGFSGIFRPATAGG
jgi:hypothetical protein